MIARTLLILVGCILVVGLVVAGGTAWFDKTLPSDKLTNQDKTKLADKDITQWKTNQYWREGNCYYYDLQIGNSTNITWSDMRRELSCGKILSDEQIADLQLADVSWTLGEINKDVIDSPTVKIDSVKGEDFEKSKVIK